MGVPMTYELRLGVNVIDFYQMSVLSAFQLPLYVLIDPMPHFFIPPRLYYPHLNSRFPADPPQANWKHNEDTVHNDLSTARNQYNDQDAALEEGFSRAVTAVKQGYSENNLDNRVGEALHCLNLIENNYRAFHSTMVAIAQQYPRCDAASA
jgi:hypothetical protein